MDAELAAALALLDEFPAPHGSLFPADEPEPEPQAPISSGQRRFRDPAVDRRRRQRRREERAELRRQAERGERRVAELRASNGKAGGGGWEQEVRRQQQARQAAERTNAGLRAALMAFLDAGARLRHQLPLLAAADELPGDEVVQLTSDFRAVVRTPLLFRSEPSHEAMAREARMLLQDTFMATDAVLDRHRRDDAAEISLASSVWPLQAADGDCVEHVTSTPLPCSFQKSFELLQRWMVRHFGYSINGITYSDIDKQLSGRRVEVRSNVELGGPQHSTVCRWVSAYEKHEDVGQVTLVYTTLIAHPNNKMRFQQRGWIVITPSPADPMHKSLVRTCSHLITFHAVPSLKGGSSSGARDDPLRHHVQRQLCKRMKYKVKDLQSHFLRETGQHDRHDLVST